MGKEGKGMASKEKEEFEGGRRREREIGGVKGWWWGSFLFSFLFSFFVYRIRSVAGILLILVLVFISICNKETF